MESPEDDKTQALQRIKCQDIADCSLVASPNIICEPVPVDTKSSADSSVRQTQMKWRNAFAYVYQVRRKLSSQPLIYNEFIELMRRVHNRCIETTEVVAVISDLFKNYPDLIRGFNTFLPEVHKIETEVKLHVGVSGIPSPDSPSGDPSEQEELPITSRIIRFTLNVRKRFEDDEKRPDKYKRFVEVLYLYKALSQQLQGLRKCKKKLREEDVYAEVRKLFENNDDLLREFSEYLPYNRKLSDIYRDSYRYNGGESMVECTCCSEVSSSGQADIKKEGLESCQANCINDEVTSSDGSGHDGNDNIASEITIVDKKFDIMSSHFNHVKLEAMEGLNGFTSGSDTRGDESLIAVDDSIDEISIEEVNELSGYISENSDGSYPCKIQPDEIQIETKEFIMDDKYFPRKIVDNHDISEISKTIIKEEYDIKPYDDKYFSDESMTDTLKNDSPKVRSHRKPLTPFKVPNPPSTGKFMNQETKATTKRPPSDKFDDATSANSKRQAVRQALSRSPSPPDLDTPIITRLAKRTTRNSPDESYTSGSSPRRPSSSNTPTASPQPSSPSDKRLKHLKKRLRRLANF